MAHENYPRDEKYDEFKFTFAEYNVKFHPS